MELLLVVFGIVLLAIIIIAIWINRKQDDHKNAQLNKLTEGIRKFSSKLEPRSLNLMNKDVQQKGVFGSQKDNKKSNIIDSKDDPTSPFTWVPVTSYKDETQVIVKANIQEKEESKRLTDVKINIVNSNLQNDFACNILLVDDSLTVLKFTGKLLTKNNYKVVTKMDGWEALTYLQNSKNNLPDIIISDIEMPNMDGIEFINKVRLDKKFNNIPVIIISASAEKHLDLMENELIQGFLHKPYKEDDLLQQLKYVLLNS